MPEFEHRRDWMGLLAKSPADEVARLWRGTGLAPDFTWLRAPETGGVMVQGRAGGTGAPFNLGEMTVTRCALQLGEGAVGHGYVQGRDKAHAQTAALIDGLMQTPAATHLRDAVLRPLFEAQAERREARASRSAATRVDFFTLVRGEDAT